MADWDVQALLLRQIDLRLAGANWQRSGGKGRRPEPVPLPGDKNQGGEYQKPTGDELANRLRSSGHIPPEPAA